MGLCRAGMGWLLGLGSGGKCLFFALDHWNSLIALGDDSRKTGYVEGLEYRSDSSHISLDNLWNLHHAKRDHSLGSFFRTIITRLDFPGILSRSAFDIVGSPHLSTS